MNFSKEHAIALSGAHKLTLKNRLIRSSLGGRMAFYDGQVNDVWRKFECRFAEGGVAAIISPTFTIDDDRWSPLQFPKISENRFVDRISEAVRAVQSYDNCRYILQIGDPGYHTQTSLFKEREDCVSSSGGFDLLYGYCNRRHSMSGDQIEQTVHKFARAAARVKDAGCDGIEVTASKGYLIHQFLNPAINRRRDCYGGSLENRFRLLREVILAIRRSIGPSFLLGVRLSARDYNYLPWYNVRWPPYGYFLGNGLDETLQIGAWLRDLRDEQGVAQGINYLHITNGYGFINPRENPGELPVKMVRQLFRSTAHLTFKARLRSMLVAFPGFIWTSGWRYVPKINLDDAALFQKRLGLPVIVNGGFQRLDDIEEALERCDFVSMARALLATPNLPWFLARGAPAPPKPCTFCNRCAVATTMYPLGCYDESRYGSDQEKQRRKEKMEAAIIEMNSP